MSTDRTALFGAREGNEGIVRCDACPVLCRIRPGRAGACSRYANQDGALVRVKGKGTFVSHGLVRSTLHLASFN